MSDPARDDGGDLTFDRVVPGAAGDAVAVPQVTCTTCHGPVATEYYEVNGSVVCGTCRDALEQAAQTPKGIAPLIVAAVYGFGAAIAGAIIYYAVLAFLDLEIGIVAILTGYMVGYAVRKGASGAGGLRFQLIAVALTYLSVAMAYTPIAVKSAIEHREASQKQGNAQVRPAAVQEDSSSSSHEAPSAGQMLIGILMLVGLVCALPLLVIIGSMPSSVISALILFFGLRQAWTMTRAVDLIAFGPYRVGSGTAAGA